MTNESSSGTSFIGPSNFDYNHLQKHVITLSATELDHNYLIIRFRSEWNKSNLNLENERDNFIDTTTDMMYVFCDHQVPIGIALHKDFISGSKLVNVDKFLLKACNSKLELMEYLSACTFLENFSVTNSLNEHMIFIPIGQPKNLNSHRKIDFNVN